MSGVAVEALLNQRLEIGAQLLARVQPEAAKIGINVLAVEVKDVMFPAELKRAFADVLKAKQEGQAALERARGESASLRNLANAARVLEGNPALMNLRLMQSLSAAQNAGSTLVWHAGRLRAAQTTGQAGQHRTQRGYLNNVGGDEISARAFETSNNENNENQKFKTVMKKKSKTGLRGFQLKVLGYGSNSYYIDRVADLEKALAKRPRRFQIDLVGNGEIPADWALLIRSILIQRAPQTQLITNARSSLQDGSVLVWLLGDCRMIRD